MGQESNSKTVQDALYDALVNDEDTLQEHDKKHHPDGYNPETDSCKFREKKEKEDSADDVDADRGVDSEEEVDIDLSDFEDDIVKEETTNKESPKSRIATVYKDWVEEDVPEWVDELSDEDAEKYAELLEEARDAGGDDDGDSLERLEAFEKPHKEKEAEKKKESEAAEKKKVEEGSDKNSSSHKDLMDAVKRLGTDAYKPEPELKKILDFAKKHMTDKRWAQKAKDIETILADRESKKNLPPKEGGKYVGDESPRAERNMKIMAEALSRYLAGD